MSKLSPEDWDAYWSTPVLTSVNESFPDNYDGEILAFWEKALSGDLDHVVDLACGNGALVWISNQILNQPTPTTQVTGVDIANITPFKILKKKQADFPKVNFIGNNPIDKLPFEDHSIDMVTSQWGLEYSDLEQVIPELGRVLKPQSRMAFLCHHESSHILKDSVEKQEKFELLLNHGDIHGSYLALDELYNANNTVKNVQSNPTFVRITGRINRTLLEIRHKFHLSKDPSIQSAEQYLQNLAALFPKTGGSKNSKRKKQILEGQSQLEATKARLDDLLSAALSIEDYAALIALIEKQGFTVHETGELLYKGKISVGSVIVADRS